MPVVHSSADLNSVGSSSTANSSTSSLHAYSVSGGRPLRSGSMDDVRLAAAANGMSLSVSFSCLEYHEAGLRVIPIAALITTFHGESGQVKSGALFILQIFHRLPKKLVISQQRAPVIQKAAILFFSNSLPLVFQIYLVYIIYSMTHHR